MVFTLIQNYPLLSLVILSFIITLGLTLIYKYFSDQKEIKASKDKIKELQEKIKGEKDAEKLMAYQKEMLEVNMKHMRHSMKPMLLTFIPLIFIFMWLRNTYTPFGVLLPWNFYIPGFCWLLAGLCDGAGWFLVYLFSSFAFSLSLRKILKVH